MKGRFIVLEGIDGSGKSTLSRSLAEALSRECGVVLTCEPSDGWVGDAVRRAHDEDSHPLLESLLFVADRAHHTHAIGRWLQEGKTVLCDRYYASTLAYQAAALGEGMLPWLRILNDEVVLRPDLTLLLDLDPGKGMERVNGRGGTSKFEKVDYLREVRRIYLRVAEEDGFHVLDASKPPQEVLEQALAIVRAELELV